MNENWAQDDEFEAMSAIYGSDWRREDETLRSYSMRINEQGNEVILYLKFTPSYPSKAPPIYELSAPNLNREQKMQIEVALGDVYQGNMGDPILYLWTEKVREVLTEMLSEKKKTEHQDDSGDEQTKSSEGEADRVACPVIIASETIQDRKSTFLAHTARVYSKEEVDVVVNKLKEDKKISQATHNIVAYRIQNGDNGSTLLQDCDDDGEIHAGRRLLHLLDILNLTNVVVVVSRWYGGIHLGPDRFKHINNAARHALETAAFIPRKK